MLLVALATPSFRSLDLSGDRFAIVPPLSDF